MLGYTVFRFPLFVKEDLLRRGVFDLDDDRCLLTIQMIINSSARDEVSEQNDTSFSLKHPVTTIFSFAFCSASKCTVSRGKWNHMGESHGVMSRILNNEHGIY